MKHLNHRGIPLFANTKREKKNSKFIFAKGMIKRDINVGIRRFVIRNDVRNDVVKERIRKNTDFHSHILIKSIP